LPIPLPIPLPIGLPIWLVGGWGLPPRPVVADAGYGDATEFRLGLDERGLSYVVAVKATTSAYPV
jgi:hypothetical protein